MVAKSQQIVEPAGRKGMSLAELKRHQPLIEAAVRHELFVRALFDDLPLIQDDHPICPSNRAQPMRDHQGRPAHHQALERLLNELLRGDIEGACRLVEHQHTWVLQERTRNRNPLLLPA